MCDTTKQLLADTRGTEKKLEEVLGSNVTLEIPVKSLAGAIAILSGEDDR